MAKKKTLHQQVSETDMPTKFYRTGMALSVAVIMGFGGWYFTRLTGTVDQIVERVIGIERKQDKSEYIQIEQSKKIDDLQKEIRKLQK